MSKRKWRITKGRKRRHVDARFIIEGESLTTKDVFIAKAYGHDNQDVDKNALLISSAPELLEELLLALPFVEEAEGDPAYDKVAIKRQVKRIRNAIAKATGKS